MDLKWLGGRVGHPLADARQAHALVAELSAVDSGSALRQITRWLESLNQTEGLGIHRRFEIVDVLDGAANSPWEQLSQDYLSASHQQKYQGVRLWNGLYGYWKGLGDAYLACIRDYEHGSNSTTAFRKSLPVIVARALRALTLQLKWELIRYGPVEPRVWAEIARLYRLAEQAGVAEGAIAIYPGEHGTTTPQREFLKALVLAASSPDGLLPMRLEIAERAIAHLAGAFRLSTRPEGCTYGFDLALSKPPVRLLNQPDSRETLRFFAARDALADLDQLTARILRGGVTPERIDLGGSRDKGAVTGVLNHLAQVWSQRPPTRGAERRQIVSCITVVPGLNDIIGTLEPHPDDDLDFSNRLSTESWIVDNMSDCGYGAIIPARKGDWIRVGALIGVRGETSENWTVGLIRRIASDEHRQRRVGIQLLQKTETPIRIARIAEWNSLGVIDREPQQPAILLASDPGDEEEIGVVLHRGALRGCDGLEMEVGEKYYLLRATRIIEGGEDFDWAMFRIMQRGA